MENNLAKAEFDALKSFIRNKELFYYLLFLLVLFFKRKRFY